MHDGDVGKSDASITPELTVNPACIMMATSTEENWSAPWR